MNSKNLQSTNADGNGIAAGLAMAAVSMAVNAVLAVVKVTVGFLGHSYALVADGIESAADVASSLVVWGGLRYASKPPDVNHPYGHGKAESLAAVVVSLALMGTACLIVSQSIIEIRRPHQGPAWYTLITLIGVIVIKEALFHRLARVGKDINSRALLSDAWHQRSDAISSLAALIGISVALIGGPGFETADDWAALLACGVIFFNGVRMLRPALDEIMDAAVPKEAEQEVRRISESIDGVVEVEKCRIRKAGLLWLMDLHVMVDGNLSVAKGHDIAHQVVDALKSSPLPVGDATVHIEPHPHNHAHREERPD